MWFMSAAKRHVLIVGGGISGLLAARNHALAGAQVTVIEESHRWGGRVSSHLVGGLLLDAGAESFATRNPAVASLAREVGLGGRIVNPSGAPAWVVSPTRAYPLPTTGWLGIPTRPMLAEVRAVIGWRAALAARAESRRPLGRIDPAITVGELVRSRLGDAVADMLVAPVVQGVYSRPVDELPLAAIDPGLVSQLDSAGSLSALAASRRAAAPAGSAVQGIDGGVWTLTQALVDDARARGVRLLSGVRAERIEQIERGGVAGARDARGATGARGAPWCVVVGGDGVAAVSAGAGSFAGAVAPAGVAGGTREIEADQVILATTQGVACALVPGASAATRAAMRAGDPLSSQVALVTLVLDAPELDRAPRGTGVLAIGGVTRAKALTHATAKWDWLRAAAGGRHVVRLSYALPDPGEDVAAFAVADASRLLGVRLTQAQVEDAAVVVWPDAAPGGVGAGAGRDAVGRDAAGLDAAALAQALAAAPGVSVVGAAAGLTGLAAIVGAALADSEPDLPDAEPDPPDAEPDLPASEAPAQ